MAISITERPSKTLSNGFLSKWSSSELPLQYKLSSDKFPTNTSDISRTITNLFYDSALKGVNITFNLFHILVIKDTVLITGTNTSLDGGIYTVKNVLAGDNIIIDVRVNNETSTTGTGTKNYTNYKGLVKVFAGSPDQHPYNIDNSKPLEEIGVIEVDFKEGNIGIADVRGYIKASINAKFDTDENTHYGWSSYSVQYAETYDSSDGVSVTTYTSDFVDDLTTVCDPFTDFVDPSFNNGLTDWIEDNGGDSWVGGVGSVSVSTTSESNVLYQSKDLRGGNEYQITVNYNVTDLSSGGNFLVLILNAGDGGVFSSANSTNTPIRVTGSGTHVFNYTPSRDFDSIGISVSQAAVFGNVDIDINSLNISTPLSQPCLYTQWANFGSKQFQDSLGGNFGDYVLNSVDTITPKMLTHFDSKTYFKGKPFYFSGIIPSSTFSLSEDNDNLYLDILLDNGFSTKVQVLNSGEGVYTVDLEPYLIDAGDWLNGTARFSITPTNNFTDCDFGTFEDDTPANWNISSLNFPTEVQSSTTSRTGNYSGNLGFNSPSISIGETEIKLFDTPIKTNIGLDYVFNSYYYNEGNAAPDYIGKLNVYFKIEGTNIITNKILIDTSTPPYIWESLSVTFKPTTETIRVILCVEALEDINSAGGAALLFDDITNKGPIDYISEIKPITNSKDCDRYGGTLRWLNDLNGWESWNFTKKKIVKEKVAKKIDVVNDYSNDWDNSFINGETQKDTIQTTVNKSIVLRSQLLNTNQKTILEQIKRSARVQYLTDANKWQTVTIRAGSYDIIDEEEKIHEMEIEINLPDLIIQAQ